MTPALGPASSVKAFRGFASRALTSGGVLAIVAAGFAWSGRADAVEIKVLLDLDGSPSTGCNIVTPAGTFAGADQVLIATVDTASNRVTTLQRQVCSGGTLGAPVDVAGPFTPPWPIGPGNGAFGSALVESYFPLSLAGFVAPTIPVGFVVSDAGGDEDALLPAGALPTDGAATRIPALSSWGVLLLSALILFAGFALLRRRRGAVAALGVVLLVTGLAGVAWAAITLDGQASDWAGIDPLATKPPSAHPTHPELLAVYGVVQDGNMFFRADATLCSTIGITPTTLVNATVGTAYPDTTFTASGGSGSYTWSETGALPANMTFSAGGELSGTPTASGSFTFTVTAVDANGCSGSQQVTLDVCVTPSVSIVASATTICAGTPVTFTATPVEGGAAPSYQWRVNGGNVGTDSPSFASSTLADGDQVDVVMTSNASPCTSVNPVGSNVIAMTVHANPATPSITPVPAQVCAGSTGNQASGPAGAASYAWSISGGTITSATNIQTITYTAGASGTVGLTLTVSNASGCTASNTANVTINANPATPSITPVPAQVCADSTGNQASGPAGATSYAWSISNGTITSAANIQTITYTAGSSGTVGLGLTVTNASGCGAASSLDVTINTNPATPALATSGVQAVTVTGGAGSFTLSFNGQTTASLAFNASAAQVQSALNALSSISGVGGTASVVLSGNVYWVSFGGTLTGPQAQMTGAGSGGAAVAVAPVVCADSTGNQASGPAGAASYAWTISNGTITSAANIQTITYTAGSSGTVGLTLVVTNASGCSATSSLDVTVEANPATPTITPSASTVCAGSTGNTADGPAGATSYAWSISNGTITSATDIQTITWTAGTAGTTTLTLTVGNDSGCTATNSTDVTVNASPATPTINAPTTVCSASTCNTASGPAGAASYAWSITGGTITSATNIQTITFTAGASGTVDLTLTVTNANGCPATNSTSVAIDPAIIVSRSSGGSFPAGTYNAAYTSQSVTATGGDSSFTFAVTSGTLPSGLGLMTNGAISGTPTATGTFTFTVTATDTDGCKGAQSFTIAINPVATNDSYSTLVDNTQAAVTGGLTGSPATPFVGLSGAVLANDQPAGGVTATAGTVPTTAGGSVTIASDGTFLYTPKANPTAAATTSDSFSYQISSNTGGTPTATTATGTVSLTLAGRVWYVKNNGSAGNGQSQSPFSTLSAAIAASTSNDYIYVYQGDGTTSGLATASTLKSGQSLIGQGAALVVNANTLVAAGGFPLLGNTVTLAGSVTINGIDMTTGANTGISGGSVSGDTVTVRNLTSTTGTAVSLNGTVGTFSFTSVSASGAANGISLTNTTGSFTVTGSGGTCTSTASTCTGGTIQNTTGHAISLTSAQSPSFSYMKITNVALSGIWGTQVSNFTLGHSVIDGVNTSHDTTDANVAFNKSAGGSTENNLSGTVSITNNTLNNSWQNGVAILNYAGTISSLTITGNSLTSAATFQAGSAGTAIQVLAEQGSSAGAQITTGSISANTINNFPGGGGIVVHGGSTANLPAVHIGSSGSPILIEDNTITGAGTGLAGIGTNGIELTIGHNSTGYFTVGASGHPNTITNVAGDGVACSLFGTGTEKCTIAYNTINAHNTAGSPGINTGADSATSNTNAGTLYLDIHDNTISNTTGNGILATVRNVDSTGIFHIENNNVSAPTTTANAIYGIRVDAGNGGESAGATVCLKIDGNITAGNTNGSATITAPGIGLRQNHATGPVATFNIDGLTPNPSNDAQMEAYVGNAGQNPGSANGSFGATGVASISGGATFHAGTCTIP